MRSQEPPWKVSSFRTASKGKGEARKVNLNLSCISQFRFLFFFFLLHEWENYFLPGSWWMISFTHQTITPLQRWSVLPKTQTEPDSRWRVVCQKPADCSFALVSIEALFSWQRRDKWRKGQNRSSLECIMKEVKRFPVIYLGQAT